MFTEKVLTGVFDGDTLVKVEAGYSATRRLTTADNPKSNVDMFIAHAPVTVASDTDPADVGSVLTATLGAGWSATGFQWTRDDVAITLATDETYTVVEADQGAVLGVTVSGLSFTPSLTFAIPAAPAP